MSKRFVALLLVCLLLSLGLSPAAAQGLTPEPININENRDGTLSAEASAAAYVVNVTSPQTATVQVLALTPGLIPRFTVTSPAGVVIATVTTPGSIAAQTVVTFATPGDYQIQVTSASGVFGDILVSLIGGGLISPPVPITLAQVVNESVDAATTLRAYTFPASSVDTLELSVQPAEGALTGVIVTLQEAETGEVVATSSARLTGVSFRIPPGSQTYTVLITGDGTGLQQQFRVCVGTETGVSSCPAVGAPVAQNATAVPTPIPFVPVTIPPGGPCQVASAAGATVNVRGGPSTSSPVVSRLTPQATAPVIGRLPDNTWYQVNLGGIIGWISGTVVVTGGNCGGVPAVTLTPSVFTPSATVAGTATPTSAATGTATATATATTTPTIAPVATLNFSLPPVYGSTALTSGFVPDPFQVGITAGGPANVNYLGGGCTGFATSAPSFSVTYTSGAFPTLRFYFVGSSDTTMIINSPSGSYFCNDDSFGTLNPTIDFNSPSSGRYDVWIGTFASGSSVGGTLFVTENTGNRP